MGIMTGTEAARATDRLASFDLELRAHQQRAFRATTLGLVAFCVAILLAVKVSQFDLVRLIGGIPRLGEFLGGMVPRLSLATLPADLANWYWGLGKWLRLLWTTFMMALFGTAVGTLIGGALGLLAARNLGVPGVVSIATRRFLELARTIPDLVYALIFLFAFGLGPLAGVLAIALHTLGAQGKLFADANENIDLRPLEGVRASGGRWLDEMSVGLLPQVLPNYVSYSLWRLEINMRSATIIGFVGAGGIGMELYESISLNYFDDAGAILLLVFFAVFALDVISERLRTFLTQLTPG